MLKKMFQILVEIAKELESTRACNKDFAQDGAGSTNSLDDGYNSCMAGGSVECYSYFSGCDKYPGIANCALCSFSEGKLSIFKVPPCDLFAKLSSKHSWWLVRPLS